MAHHIAPRHAAKFKYQELEDEDDGPRLSTSSDSPILPKLDVEEFEEDDMLQGLAEGETFDTAGVETFYEPVEGYEGAHRYDPEYRWSKKDEAKVVRKVSGRISVDRAA
jgi:hypothetical protein